MFCPKCGNEIADEAIICPKCGCSVENGNGDTSQTVTAPVEENKTLQKCAVVFAFLMPIVGLILGIIGTIKYKDEKLKKQCILAIIISIVVWIIGMLLVSMG